MPMARTRPPSIVKVMAVTRRPCSSTRMAGAVDQCDFEGHGLGVPLVPLVRRQAEKAAPVSYENLKRLLETER
jgi:hypothetical protein